MLRLSGMMGIKPERRHYRRMRLLLKLNACRAHYAGDLNKDNQQRVEASRIIRVIGREVSPAGSGCVCSAFVSFMSFVECTSRIFKTYVGKYMKYLLISRKRQKS